MYEKLNKVYYLDRAREEYEKLGEQTFDERYEVSADKLTPMTNSIVKGLEKVREVRQRSIEDNIYH